MPASETPNYDRMIKSPEQSKQRSGQQKPATDCEQVSEFAVGTVEVTEQEDEQHYQRCKHSGCETVANTLTNQRPRKSRAFADEWRLAGGQDQQGLRRGVRILNGMHRVIREFELQSHLVQEP